jgi:hypothetical protein
MAVLDASGRLFGRINVIDAVALAAVIVAVPAMVLGYRALKHQPVDISDVQPSALTAGQPMRVHVTGREFRPFLQAYAGRTGQPFTLQEVDRLSQRASFLLASPTSVELVLPELQPGTYDLRLYDQGHEVASRAAAITVREPEHPKGLREVTVRFYPLPETVPLIRVGDRDVPGGATVAAARTTNERAEIMEMHLTQDDQVWSGQKMTGQLVELTLQVPQTEVEAGRWLYGDRLVRAGDVFPLTTDRYKLHGVVTSVGDVRRLAARKGE